MSGFFGCGSRRNVAILAASKPDLVAMLENGGALPVTSRWSAATTWQGSHHRRASFPHWAHVAGTGRAIIAMVKQAASNELQVEAGSLQESRPFLGGTLCVGSRPPDRICPIDVANVEAYR
jgi:hypothetical protein